MITLNIKFITQSLKIRHEKRHGKSIEKGSKSIHPMYLNYTAILYVIINVFFCFAPQNGTRCKKKSLFF